jgi:hypothetical protein
LPCAHQWTNNLGCHRELILRASQEIVINHYEREFGDNIKTRLERCLHKTYLEDFLKTFVQNISSRFQELVIMENLFGCRSYPG